MSKNLYEKRHRYSIRKLSVGVGSLLIGASILCMQPVLAQEAGTESPLLYQQGEELSNLDEPQATQPAEAMPDRVEGPDTAVASLPEEETGVPVSSDIEPEASSEIGLNRAVPSIARTDEMVSNNDFVLNYTAPAANTYEGVGKRGLADR